MISEKIYQNFEKRLIAIAISTVICFLIFWILNIQPRVRLNFENFFLALVFALAYRLMLELIEKFTNFTPPSYNQNILNQENWGERITTALSISFVEEFFLRVFVCGYLASIGWVVSVTVSFAISFGLYFQNRNSWKFAAQKGFEGLLLLALFFYTEAIFPVIAARFILELLLSVDNISVLKNVRLTRNSI